MTRLYRRESLPSFLKRKIRSKRQDVRRSGEGSLQVLYIRNHLTLIYDMSENLFDFWVNYYYFFLPGYLQECSSTNKFLTSGFIHEKGAPFRSFHLITRPAQPPRNATHLKVTSCLHSRCVCVSEKLISVCCKMLWLNHSIQRGQCKRVSTRVRIQSQNSCPISTLKRTCRVLLPPS